VPVRDDVGVLVAAPERGTEIQLGEGLARDRIPDDGLRGEHGLSQDHVEHPELVERPNGVGPQLKAGSDLGEPLRLLHHVYPPPGAGQRERRGQPADPAADDEYILSESSHATTSSGSSRRNSRSACSTGASISTYTDSLR
jgi:hypothetical protein